MSPDGMSPDGMTPGGMRSTPGPRAGKARPRQDPVLLGLVVLGGSAGTAVRVLAAEAFPAAPTGWPWTTFAVNVSGALLLAALLEVLARTGRDTPWRRRLRIGVGTGFLGGYTTYSTFAVEVAQRAPVFAAGYAVATVLVGMAAAIVGHRLARQLLPDRSGHAAPDPAGGGAA